MIQTAYRMVRAERHEKKSILDTYRFDIIATLRMKYKSTSDHEFY